MATAKLSDLPQRIQDKIKVDAKTGCWLWTAATLKPRGNFSGGYGIGEFEGRTSTAHRAIFEIFKGEISKPLQLDHLCRVRHCVNPDHLEPVTCKTNLHRGANRLRETCSNGHKITPTSMTVYIDKRGWEHRRCNECRRIARRKQPPDRA